MKKPSEEVQLKAVYHIKDTFYNYDLKLKSWKERMYQVYKSYSMFVNNYSDKEKLNINNFKINKAHEIVEKIFPRIMSKNPKFIVTPKINEFIYDIRNSSEEEKQKIYKNMQDMTSAIQDYLSYLFEEYRLKEPIRNWAKSMVIYGTAFAKVKFKYEKMITSDRNINEEGESEYSTNEEVIGEYPTIDSKSWADLYFDPKYKYITEMPALIEVIPRVRCADLYKNKDEYFNIDKIEGLPSPELFESDPNGYKSSIYNLTGMSTLDMTGPVDKNCLTLKKYYGYFCEHDEKKEKMYEMCTVNDLILISMKEIIKIPFVDIKAFEDPEVYFGKGFVEPIIRIQEELNFKKNAASDYINKSLNREYIWSPMSGIDPRDLISRPGNIIVTNVDGITAQNNLIELPNREINNSYFSEEADLERQIQSLTFTIDTSAQRNDQGLTNTATGIRVKFFESNSVIDEVRKHFEEGLERIAYMLLQETFENVENNIVFKKLDDTGFWEVNKEIFRNVLTRYSIKVEANSSSYDSIEDRRADAIAFFNLGLQAKQAGVNVNMEEVFKDVINTFEKHDVNKYVQPAQVDIQSLIPGMGQGQPQQGGSTPQQVKMPEMKQSGMNAGDLTSSITKSPLTTGL